MGNGNKNNRNFLSWKSMGLITFSTLWGFHALINAYFYIGYGASIGVWIVMLLVFFLPYVMMVSELGSTFKSKEGGASSWAYHTIGPKAGFICGWISWVVVLPYLTQKPSLIIVSFNWMLFGNGDVSYLDPKTLQIIGIVIYLCCALIAVKGLKVIKIIATIAGAGNFAMCILFIILALFAPLTNSDVAGAQTYAIDWNLSKLFPFDIGIFASMSIIIFAVGGPEKSSPYVNKLKNPSKDYPKGIIFLFVMVLVSAILGSIGVSMMFGQEGQEVGTDFITNGQFIAFQKLGAYTGLGNIFLVVFAITRLISDISVLIVTSDVPLRTLLGNADTRFIPKNSMKKNKNDVYIYWLIAQTAIVFVLMIIPIIGTGSVEDLVQWLLELNSICYPICYSWVFITYFFLKFNQNKIALPNDRFIFIKNRKIGMCLAVWTMLFILVSIVMQIQDENPFLMLMNIAIPSVLVLSGVILPLITKKYNIRNNIK